MTMAPANLRLSLVGSGRPGSHVFGTEGGTFGRSQKCDWVLPDEERILSSTHGRVVFRNGEFMLFDESTNGIFVNGLPEPLGRGNSVVLTSGTRFAAGRYLVEAQIVAAEQRPESRPRPPASNGAQPAPGYRHAQYNPQSVPMAGRSAEDALRDRSELGSLFAQNSQDPLGYMTDAVDAGIGGSFDPQGRGRDPLAFPAGGGGSPQPAGYGQGGFGAAPFQSQPADALLPGQAVFDDDPGAHDPLRALGPQPAAAGYPAGPVDPGLADPASSYGRLPPQPVRQAMPQVAQPAPQGPGTTMIPADFLSSLAIPKRNRGAEPPSSFQPQRPAGSGQFLPTGLQPPAGAAQPLPFQPPQPSPPPAPVSGIPAGFDPLPPGPAQSSAAPQPAGSRQAQPPVPFEAEQRTTLGGPGHASSAAGGRPNGLSPALMADIVEFDSPQDGAAGQAAGRPEVPLDTLEALKARREQRKAAMLRKAQTGAGAPLPSAPPMPGVLPAMPPAPAPSTRMAAAASASVPGARPAAGAGSGDSGPVAAFLEGMGFPDASLSPTEYDRLMREAGATIRAMAAGLILLLSARRMVKSEFRMDETQVQPEENNPFKFFKVAELALDELFLTRAGGYQAPAEAARSAFEDLEQHTMLTMSAMQRAIKLIFERLSPDALTREADEGGGLRIRGLTPRKGKLEAFAESHEKMSRNIDTVARQVIAEAFAQVQEEHARQRSREYWESKP